jgi:hypothetical protein
MIDARQTDGFVAIGTHGNGVYSAYYTPPAGIEESQHYKSLQVGNVFPDPVQNEVQVEVIAKEIQHLNVKLYSATGKLLQVVENKTIQHGKQYLQLQFHYLSSGVYYLVFQSGKESILRKFVKI